MTPENVEDDLFAERQATGVWTFSDAPNGRYSAARESLVAFKFGGTAIHASGTLPNAVDHQGVGEARRISQLLRHFFAWCPTPAVLICLPV